MESDRIYYVQVFLWSFGKLQATQISFVVIFPVWVCIANKNLANLNYRFVQI
jgi:hypothetical protein